jgi:hypothetical protein
VPKYNVVHNQNGKITKVSFTPNFRVGNQYEPRPGKALMKYGGFQLDGWQWNSTTGEIYKTSDNVDGITQDVQVMVGDVDESINRLLKRYLDWARFYDVHSKLNEKNG